MKKITILTVCLNAEKTIEKTILSVISQTYKNIEYVIVDGESSDGTLAIIDKYRNKQFVIISEPDRGIYDAINKGLNMASGDFLLILGADDSLAGNDVIEKIEHYLTNEYIYYGNVFRTIHKDVYCGNFNSYKMAVKNISHQSIFYPKNIYKSKKYIIEYKIFADYAYNLELWRTHKFYYIPIVVANFNDGASSATVWDFEFEKNRNILICKNLGRSQYYYSVVYRWLSSLYHRFRNSVTVS